MLMIEVFIAIKVRAGKLDEVAEKLDGKLEVGATHNHHERIVIAPGAASTVGKGRMAVAGD